MDNTDFLETDIPLEVPVPESQYLNVRFFFTHDTAYYLFLQG